MLLLAVVVYRTQYTRKYNFEQNFNQKICHFNCCCQGLHSFFFIKTKKKIILEREEFYNKKFFLPTFSRNNILFAANDIRKRHNSNFSRFHFKCNNKKKKEKCRNISDLAVTSGSVLYSISQNCSINVIRITVYIPEQNCKNKKLKRKKVENEKKTSEVETNEMNNPCRKSQTKYNQYKSFGYMHIIMNYSILRIVCRLAPMAK